MTTGFNMTNKKDVPEDHHGFEQIAVPHMDFIYNHALRLTCNIENANDLLQETFLRAFRFWDKFEKGTNVRGWLYRVMKNSYINIYRKNVKGPPKIEYDDGIYVHDSSYTGFADGDLSDATARAIESLPDNFRTVAVLNFIEGLTYNEIADFVGCPVGTVRSRVHRSRMLLRETLLSFDGRTA